MWRDATELLKQIDQVIRILRRSGQVIDPAINRFCRVCGTGIYDLLVSENRRKGLATSEWTRPDRSAYAFISVVPVTNLVGAVRSKRWSVRPNRS